MLKVLSLSLGLVFLWSCSGAGSSSSTPKESLYEILEKQQCSSSDFRGWAVAEEEMAAINQAIAVIASSMQDTVSVQSKLTTEVIDEKDKTYCQTAKLYWNPEKKTLYSEIAFSRLSASIQMETSPCAGRGISLAYKGSEPECSANFGFSTCSYSLSLSLNACDGTEYAQLKGDAIGAHPKPDFALEKLQSNLKSAEFWNQWEKEIKQWSPKCE